MNLLLRVQAEHSKQHRAMKAMLDSRASNLTTKIMFGSSDEAQPSDLVALVTQARDLVTRNSALAARHQREGRNVEVPRAERIPGLASHRIAALFVRCPCRKG